MKIMKKTNTSSLKRVFPILAVIVLSIALLVVIHHIFTSKLSDKEQFDDLEIVIPNNFYDLTSQNFSVFSSHASTTNKINHTLSANRLCIYDNSDMECISAGELAIALDLPKYRKEHVCIDEECLGYEDLQILNGDPTNKFKISHHYSDKGSNVEHKNCLALKNINAQSCDGTALPSGITTLGLAGCSEAHHFTLHDTEIGAADIREEVDEATLVDQEHEGLRQAVHPL